jgi:Type III restriction enzyme, res subunit
MRFPTFGKPRVISCAELFIKHIALPRGCFDAAVDLLTTNGIRIQLRDERRDGRAIGARFLGALTLEQQKAATALMAHDTGVLAATTAFGKTVVAAKLIAERDRNTLILVHRQQLLDQWIARLRAFLDIDPNGIGVIRGGKKRPTDVIDVALIQSLVRKGEVSDLIENYGHLGGGKQSEKKQRHDAIGPRNLHQQHGGKPAQAAGFDEVPLGRADRIAIDAAGADLGSPAPFDGVIKSDHHWGARRHQSFYQQDQQLMRHGPRRPRRPA